MRNRTLLAFVCIALVLASCSTIQELRFDQPEVEFQGFQFEDLGFDGLTLLFDFEVDNPNDLDITAKGYNYDFLIEGSSLVSGTRDEQFEIRRKDRTTIQVPVSFTYDEVRNVFGDAFNRDSLAYEIKTDVDLDLGMLGSRKVPVNHSGHVPIPKMPDIVFDGFEVTEIGFSGVSAEVNFRVRNENSFALHMSEVNYTMVVNGNEWVSTSLEERYDIASESNSVYTVPINIGLSKAGSDVIQTIRNGGPINYEIRGNASVGADIRGFNRDANLPFEFEGEYRF